MATPPPLPPQPLSYATPVQPMVATAAWRRGDQLITTRTISLPDACVRCNQPGVKRFRKDLYWHEPWIYLLILPGLLIYAICAIALRKKATVECSLCPAHAKKRMTRILITWLIVLAAIGCWVLAAMGMNDAFGRAYRDMSALFIPLGILVVIGAAVYAAIVLPILKPKKIDEQYAYLKGAGPEFLAKFAEA